VHGALQAWILNDDARLQARAAKQHTQRVLHMNLLQKKRDEQDRRAAVGKNFKDKKL
jgi:hypothetical protein